MIERLSETRLVFVGETGTRGLHSRNAAFLTRWVAGLDASMDVSRDGRRVSFRCSPPSAVPFLKLAGMGAKPGGRVTITASGPDARRAIDGAARALEEEPPVVSGSYGPHERQRMEDWRERITRGIPANRELEEEMDWWLYMTSLPDLTAEKKRDLDRRAAEILAAEGLTQRTDERRTA